MIKGTSGKLLQDHPLYKVTKFYTILCMSFTKKPVLIEVSMSVKTIPVS